MHAPESVFIVGKICVTVNNLTASKFALGDILLVIYSTCVRVSEPGYQGPSGISGEFGRIPVLEMAKCKTKNFDLYD